MDGMEIRDLAVRAVRSALVGDGFAGPDGFEDAFADEILAVEQAVKDAVDAAVRNEIPALA